eukprot:GHVP01040651.1.p1 GENE.GHVP01040651.1~~GHVP01040651.1.p1  ORF type:complete len:467 (-),score=82.73 GHVP01040651.1:14-1414(-)
MHHQLPETSIPRNIQTNDPHGDRKDEIVMGHIQSKEKEARSGRITYWEETIEEPLTPTIEDFERQNRRRKLISRLKVKNQGEKENSMANRERFNRTSSLVSVQRSLSSRSGTPSSTDSITRGIYGRYNNSINKRYEIMGNSTTEMYDGYESSVFSLQREQMSEEAIVWIESVEKNYPEGLVRSVTKESIISDKTKQEMCGKQEQKKGIESYLLVRILSARLFNNEKNIRVKINAGKDRSMKSNTFSDHEQISDNFLLQTITGDIEKVEINLVRVKQKKKGILGSIFGKRESSSDKMNEDPIPEKEKPIGSVKFSFTSTLTTNITGTYYIKNEEGKRCGEMTIQAIVKPQTIEPATNTEAPIAFQNYVTALVEENEVLVWRRYWAVLERIKLKLHFLDFETKSRNLFTLNLNGAVSVEKIGRNAIGLDHAFKLVFDDGETKEFYSDGSEITSKWLESFKQEVWGLSG